MDIVMSMVTWVTLIVTVSSLIAATTSTPKDDVWIGKIYKFIDMLALNIGKAKEVAPKK
jgi:hypothetical protein|tara:strand:+ start:324 stop:500 length:177 start_codon:yes stop_codon:yes gene_type:complete